MPLRKPVVIKKELAEKLKRKGQTRSYVEMLEPQLMRAYHPCGHTSDTNYAEQSPPQRMTAEACKFMTRYWSNNGVNAICPKCEKEKRKDPKNRFRRVQKSKLKVRIGPDWVEEKPDVV